ncbi:LURP-one-related/scramblase family protein [Marinilactibacillus piezotolerans]|uniref:LURP-one-related/scramblase family protein n=1 Tax=Marinilactibacillus piezotolerans TaxID=258723 RepID=UPI0009AF576E|nr:LURP-one-related family protein [Marinilactibacillus piezotolerans]
MVRLFINHAYMSMQNRMIVKSASGKDTYLIVGKWGRARDALSLYSMDGDRLVEAKQTLLSVFPKFDFYTDEHKIASVKKIPGLQGLKKPYYIVSHLDWIVTGDFIERQFTVKHHSQVIMRVEKHYSFQGDFYSLNIEREEYAPICCLLSVIIDHYSSDRETLWQQYKKEKYSLSFMHPFIFTKPAAKTSFLQTAADCAKIKETLTRRSCRNEH